MKKLVFIDACVRQDGSRTRRIAEPVISALAVRYEVVRYDLTEMEGIVPLDPKLFGERGQGSIPSWAVKAAKDKVGTDGVKALFHEFEIPNSSACPQERRSELMDRLNKLAA